VPQQHITARQVSEKQLAILSLRRKAESATAYASHPHPEMLIALGGHHQLWIREFPGCRSHPGEGAKILPRKIFPSRAKATLPR
jgi:hypothetical protein